MMLLICTLSVKEKHQRGYLLITFSKGWPIFLNAFTVELSKNVNKSERINLAVYFLRTDNFSLKMTPLISSC